MKLKLALLCAVALAACAPDQNSASISGDGSAGLPTEAATANAQGTPTGVAVIVTPSALAAMASDSDRFRRLDTTQLCSTYRSAATASGAKQMIEAELALRSINQCSGVNIGTQTATLVGVARFPRSGTATATNGPDYDCDDFANGAEAQRFFLAAGGPGIDPYNLDGDGDGLACEWGAQIRRIASYRAPVVAAPAAAAPVSHPRVTGGSRCYVGPRGGTYTITASGNKNYSGC